MTMEDKRRAAASGGHLQKQHSQASGKDPSAWSNSDTGSPSGATLKRLKLKVGGSTLSLTPSQRPSPEITPQSLPTNRSKSFPNPSHHGTAPPTFGTSEAGPAKRKRRAVIEESDEDESLPGGEETDSSDSDSPPPIRKRTSTRRSGEAERAQQLGAEQAFREKRSPKPKVIWDPDGGAEQHARSMPDEKQKRAKATPESARKQKRPARDAAEEGPFQKADKEALEVPVGEAFGVSPPVEGRERRLSKPRVIWDPDVDERDLLRVVSKAPDTKGPVSPKPHTSPSPKQGPKKSSRVPAGPPGVVAPVLQSGQEKSVTEDTKPLIVKSPVRESARISLQASPKPPNLVRIAPLTSPHTVPPPQAGAHSHTPRKFDHFEPGSSSPATTPGKRRDALASGSEYPSGVGVSPGGRSPQGFKPPPERSRLHMTELDTGGDWKDGEKGGEQIGDERKGGQHGLVSPSKRLADKKRLREDTEAERQLKKEERARKRKADTEKAAREVQASAIQKILGQESTRKKREEAVQKRRDAKEEERLASGAEAPGDMVRIVDNAAGVTLIWPATVPFPVELTQGPIQPPPARLKCSAPHCGNAYRYRDSKSLLPLCSLQCYKALRDLPQASKDVLLDPVT